MIRQLFYTHSHHSRLFMSQTGDPDRAKKTLLIIPPLLEEMNASRHLLSHLAEQLGDNWLTLQFDLFGTGESEGELNQGSLDIWQQNTLDLIQLGLSHRMPLHILLVRSGALLLNKAPDGVKQTLGWHPILDGREWYKPIRRMTALQGLNTSSDTISHEGYTLPRTLTEQLSQQNNQHLLPLQHSLYVANMAPNSAPDANQQLIDTAPFWLHNELPQSHFSEWIRKTKALLS